MDGGDYRKEYLSRPNSVREIRRDVADAAERLGVQPDVLPDILLATSEAATSAIVHGSGDFNGRVTVTVGQAADELSVMVSDESAGASARAAIPGLGVGLAIISSIATRMELVFPGKGGTSEIHMFFPRHRPSVAGHT